MQNSSRFPVSKTLLALYACTLLLMAGIVWSQGLNHDAKTNYPDFLHYYLFARLVNGAEGGKIYDHAAEQAVIDKFLGEPQRPGYSLITYPPTCAPFVFLLSSMPIDVAHTLWHLLGPIVLLAALYLLSAAQSYRTAIPAVLITLGAIGSIASARGTVLGQNMYFITAILAAFWWAFKTKRDVLTGLFLAISTVKFQYTPFILFAPLFSKRWKAMVWFVFFEGSILAVATVMMGVENITKYLFWMRAAEQNPLYFETVNQVSMICLRGLLSCFLPVETLTFSVPLLIIGLAISGYLFYYVNRQAPEKIDWALACSIPCGLLFAPHVHLYDSVMIAIALTSTLPYRKRFLRSSAGKVWYVLLFAWPMLGWIIMGLDMAFIHYHFGDLKMSVLTLWWHTLANAILLAAGICICCSRQDVDNAE